MDRRYAVLDVFTDTALSGNPLAVVRDAEGLDDAAMQAIAREFNLSETVFLLPPENPAHTARVRIFTPGRELPFAGHPTVGTAIYLGTERFAGDADDIDVMVVLEEKVGPVRCGVVLRPGTVSYAEFDLPRLPRVADSAPDVAAVAEALGLAEHEIGFGHFPLTVADAGVPFVIVPVNGLEAARRAAPSPERWARVFPSGGCLDIYLFTAEVERPDASYHTRMFAPTMGIAEDPATGAAAAAFAGVLHRYGQLTDGSHAFRLEQGVEMGRPSLIDLEIDVADGALHAARIGGSAVVVAEGILKA
jgi:trans-2,3-dihydro-3-hydroxyanthranilate isomerase